ncbi:MAG: hypothetical protein KF841_00370 [Phycisphaerae bacterium]|nr:hypothetical protein [Phycisphaerae bacterium]
MLALFELDGFESAGIHASLKTLDADVISAASADALLRSDRIVLPHVRSERRALASIRDGGLIGPLLTAIDAGCPVLAVSSAMHLLFDVIHGDSQHAGLGVVHGRAAPFEFGNHPAARHFSSTHQGWNQVFWEESSPLMERLTSGDYFYFDHSLFGEPLDRRMVSATANHGLEFCAVVRRGEVFGTQFLPERSEAAGRTLLENFVRYVPR